MEIQYYEHTCKCGCGGQIKIKNIHKQNGIPKYIYGHNKPMLGKFQTEITKQKIGLYNKGKKQSEEAKRKQIEAQKGKKRKPFSEEHIQKLKESHTGKTGKLASNWQDGKSFEAYGIEFNKELKKYILERDNYTCQYPGCTEIHNRLHIHHIDFNKKNSNPENLITLGNSCHTRTNGKNNRIYWTEFYQNIMINRIIECLL